MERLLLSPLAAAALVLAGCGERSALVTGVQVAATKGQAAIQTEPGRRSVVLLSIDVEGVAPVTHVLAIHVGVVFDIGAPAPLARLRLAADQNGDGRFEPEVDELIAPLELEAGGRTARGALARAVRAASRERWLVVGDVRPVATGRALALTVDPSTIAAHDAAGNGLGVASSGLVRGPAVVVADRGFASSMFLTGGGARAALVLPPNLQPARVVIAGNPVTDLRREAHGLYSFLLPPVPPGNVAIRVLDAAGTLLLRIENAAMSCAGVGPALFLDSSLSRLPFDHAFSQDAEVADLNGDGAPDLLVPSYAGQRDRLYLNDGYGRFADVSETHVPAVLADTVHAEPVDIDGDGDVDVAVAVEGGQNRIYVNDGSGRLRDVTEEPGRMPPDADYSEDIQAGDIDGDGDLDLVSANLVDAMDQRKGGQIRVYINDGKGRFADGTAARIALMATRAYDVELGDLDGDGDLDLLVACYGERNRLYRNDGPGRFTDISAALPSSSAFHTCAALGDLDGDGDLDILVGSFVGQSLFYRNDGGMQFADATALLVQGEMSTYDVALGDLDGDGDLDILYANTANPSILALNDGKGRFTLAPAGSFFTPDDNAYDVQVLDADGDGALDVFVTAWGDRRDALYLSRSRLPPDSTPRVVRVEPNYGPPTGATWVTLRGKGLRAGVTFSLADRPLTDVSVQDERTVVARTPAGAAPGHAPLTMHVPGDVDARYESAYAYEPLPPGAFEDVTAATLGSEPRASTAVAAGDLNGDGLEDLVFADQGQGARVRINTGGGRMRAAAFVPISASANDVALRDLDGDKKLDLILVDAAAAPWLFPGKGDGSFARPLRLIAPSDGAEEVAIGDLDSDGDLDLVFAVSGPEVVLRNDGQWRFTRLPQSRMASDPSRSVALGDADGDQDLDLFVANFQQRARLYRNDGGGRFTESAGALPAREADQSYGIALADVDGDGDLDAAVANGGAQVNRVFMNGGQGVFREAPSGVFRAALGGGAHVTFGDVDLDGDPDLFSSHFWGNNHLYFVEEGRLAERAGMLPNSPGGFAGAVFTDLDGDGDLDLVLAAFWGGSRVLRNPRKP